MKKHGFTLAEVLVTLGIIGVVAALTLPSFIANTQAAKIGPSLAKAVANFSAATKTMISNSGSEYLRAATFCADGGTSCNDPSNVIEHPEFFWVNFANNMNGTIITSATTTLPAANFGNIAFMGTDGTIYMCAGFPPIDAHSISGNPNNSSTSDNANVLIDINGLSGPNQAGRDQFLFWLMEDGSLIPKGAHNTAIGGDTWETKCAKNVAPVDGTYCAGHIFENDLKVEYK